MAKNHALTPWKNVDFWTKYKYSFKSHQLNKCVRKRPLRHCLGPQRGFTTRQDNWGHKGEKNADFKIWSFLSKNLGLTPWKKVDFWTKYKYSLEIYRANQGFRKRPLRQLLGLPRDQGQRNSPQKMKSG